MLSNSICATMAVRNIFILLAGCFVCQAFTVQHPDHGETVQPSVIQRVKFVDLEKETNSAINPYSVYQPIQERSTMDYLGREEVPPFKLPTPTSLITRATPSFVPNTMIGSFSRPHHCYNTFNQPSNFQRIKRKSDYYSGYQPFQQWSDRLRAEEAKNPPTPEERADAENTAKKAAIGLVAGALGGLITGGPPGALSGAFIGAGTGAFSDKIADTLMNKTLPAIYSRYREPAWEMP